MAQMDYDTQMDSARKEGTNKAMALMARLFSDGRTEDASRAATDEAYRNKLQAEALVKKSEKNQCIAFLSNEGSYTLFTVGDTRLKFAAPYSLEHYDSVKQWKHGYLVVMAKYSHQEKPEEDYIDLIPVLEALLFDQEAFLSQIDRVEVRYA